MTDEVELPDHGSCYICGSQNPSGLGIRFRLRDGVVSARFTLDERQQGPPGHAHGGCVTAVLDEAMGAAVWYAGHPVVAGRLEVEFRKPVPLGVSLLAEARMVSRSGRKCQAEATLALPDGAIATRAKGLFIEAPHIFEGKPYAPRL